MLPNSVIIDNVSSASISEVEKMSKYVAIYARRSVEDDRSLSCESQLEDCINSLKKEEKYKTYVDNGVSAKSTNRPQFQQMMSDIRDGIISRVLVKKYDRFSRNTRDFFNTVEEFNEYGVTVFSLTEQFNTDTDQGKLMLTMLVGMAEWERNTIATRVKDAYSTRSTHTGFYQGGKKYYGYKSDRCIVNGIEGSVLMPNEKADVVNVSYEMYMNPENSLADILNHFHNKGIDVNSSKDSNMDRSHLSRLLCSPLYVKADGEVYKYFVSQGYEIIDDIDVYDGEHGVFKHKKPDKSGFYVKVGYHMGIVDSETWLAVQDRKSQQERIPNNGEAKNSWLVGLVKCTHCNYALNIVYNWNKAHTKQWRYYHDSGFYRANRCVKKRLDIRPDVVEQIAFNTMKDRLDTLVIAKQKKSKPDKELERIQSELIRIDKEIKDIMNQVAKANEVLISLINEKVLELHTKKSELEEQLRTKQRKHKEIDTAPLTEPLSKWDSLSVDEKHSLATLMIDVIYVSDDGVDVRLSI